MPRQHYSISGSMNRIPKDRSKSPNYSVDNEIIEVRTEVVDSRTGAKKIEDAVNKFFGLLAVPFDLMRSDVNGGTERTRRNDELKRGLEKFSNGE